MIVKEPTRNKDVAIGATYRVRHSMSVYYNCIVKILGIEPPRGPGKEQRPYFEIINDVGRPRRSNLTIKGKECYATPAYNLVFVSVNLTLEDVL